MMNQPDPVPPDNSTTDLAPPEGQADALGAGNTITWTHDEAKQAGIDDPQSGDEYTVKITISDVSDGVTATVVDGSAEKSEPGEEDTAEDGSEDDEEEPQGSLAVEPMGGRKPKSRVLSPSAAGFTEDGMDMR